MPDKGMLYLGVEVIIEEVDIEGHITDLVSGVKI